MVPLEVTHTALATPAVLERMFHKGSAVSISPFKAMVELLLTFFETTYRQVCTYLYTGNEPGPAKRLLCPAFPVVLSRSAVLLVGQCFCCLANVSECEPPSPIHPPTHTFLHRWAGWAVCTALHSRGHICTHWPAASGTRSHTSCLAKQSHQCALPCATCNDCWPPAGRCSSFMRERPCMTLVLWLLWWHQSCLR